MLIQFPYSGVTSRSSPFTASGIEWVDPSQNTTQCHFFFFFQVSVFRISYYLTSFVALTSLKEMTAMQYLKVLSQDLNQDSLSFIGLFATIQSNMHID